MWIIPRERAKNGRRHEVPLSRQAMAIIKGLPRLGDSYVITLDGQKPRNHWKKDKDRLDALVQLDDWTIHDIRRTVAQEWRGLVSVSWLSRKSSTTSAVRWPASWAFIKDTSSPTRSVQPSSNGLTTLRGLCHDRLALLELRRPFLGRSRANAGGLVL